MKILIFTFFLALTSTLGFAQKTKPDSLKQALKIATTDSTRHNICFELTYYYNEVNRDSALFYGEYCLAIAKRNNYQLAKASALVTKGYQYSLMGRYAESYQNLLLALSITEDPNNEEEKGWRIDPFPIHGQERLILLARTHIGLGHLMRSTENQKQEIFYNKNALKIAHQIKYIDLQMSGNLALGVSYSKIAQLDSALYFTQEADYFSKNPAYKGLYRGINLAIMGIIYLMKGDKKKAKKYYQEGLSLSNRLNNKANTTLINHWLVQFFLQENEKDSALIYAVRNLGNVKSIRNESPSMNTGVGYEDVYLAYKLNNQVDSAYKYQGLALIAKDIFYKTRIKNLADFQNLLLEEAMHLENLEKEKIQIQSKIRTYTLLSVLAVLSIIGFILYRNNRQKQKSNAILQQKNEEIQSTLLKLKSTQTQLIQSEKLASLGELTAGIAHEIQNPLNFVNNFSELSVDLAKELKEEIEKTEIDKELIIDLATDLSQNQEKINHHGKRASSIVKGMLEHSRTSTGVKELTDINVLADEYLRLSYHGLRAKDNTFNADFKTNFDENLPKVAVIPQDFGRVLLNIINNAFYAVSQRKNLQGLKKDLTGLYTPKVAVSTEYIDNHVIIKVSDNGTGMSEATKAKIFQPFFTTKPTGEGTGLGLSLAYDIITKGHGGTLEIETKEGFGSEFIIKLNT